VGDVAPDKFSRYILPVGKPQVVTIANYQITNLTALIDAVAGSAAAGGPAAQGVPPSQPAAPSAVR